MFVQKLLRPRILAVIFGGYVLVVAIVAAFFASGPGALYRYSTDVTKWSFGIYALLAAVLLFIVGLLATGSLPRLEALVSQAEVNAKASRLTDEEGVGEIEAEPLEDLPEPLPEPASESDQVEHDIDDLLSALDTIQSSMEEAEEVPLAEMEEATVVEVPKRVVTVPVSRIREQRKASQVLTNRQEQRADVAGFFLGPALIDIGIIGLCAIVLPGAEGLLQGYNQLNTALLLGLAYSYTGVALYTVLSVYALLTNR